MFYLSVNITHSLRFLFVIFRNADYFFIYSIFIYAVIERYTRRYALDHYFKNASLYKKLDCKQVNRIYLHRKHYFCNYRYNI